jgi:hypothetical protein
MEYNTSKKDLIIPEYGRNIQQLLEHAKTLKDDALRQAYVEKVVDLMQQMHPQARNVEDYTAKLWAHAFRIGNYQLNVVPPCEIPSPDELYKRPEKIPYPTMDVRFRHYGKNVQEMVKKAVEMEDEDLQEEYIQVIGSYMKMAYNTWNRDSVSDDIIRKDLIEISRGALELEGDANLDNLLYPTRRRKHASTTSTNSSSANSNVSNNRSSRPTNRGTGSNNNNNSSNNSNSSRPRSSSTNSNTNSNRPTTSNLSAAAKAKRRRK